MSVPAGTQSGTVFRLKGKGMTDLGGYGKGDEHVRVLVETPKKLTKRQKELLKEFEKLSKNKASSQGGLFNKVTDTFGS
jgi:molecular chaperone DnaJ